MYFKKFSFLTFVSAASLLILIVSVFYLSGSVRQPINFRSPQAGVISASKIRFVVWSDTQGGLDYLSTLSDQAANFNPNLTLYPGDLVANGFDLQQMTDWRYALNGRRTGNTASNNIFSKTFVARGDHDDNQNPEGWKSFFNMQSNSGNIGAANFRQLEEEMTYSFDYGNSHFVVADVHGNANTFLTTTISAFIKESILAAEGRGLTHAFIFFHGPLYCIKEDCDCTDARGCTSGIVDDLAEFLSLHSIVSATFHGDDHFFAYTDITSNRIGKVERNYPQFVSGAAGGNPLSCDHKKRYDFCQSVRGFYLVEVDGNKFDVQAYSVGSNTPFKTFNFTKDVASKPIQPTCYLNLTGEQNVCIGDKKTYRATCTSPLSDQVTQVRVLRHTLEGEGDIGWELKTCNNKSSCAWTINWDKAGSYYISVDSKTSSKGFCSGNPWCEWPPNPPNTINCSALGAVDCGSNDLLRVNARRCN